MTVLGLFRFDAPVLVKSGGIVLDNARDVEHSRLSTGDCIPEVISCLM